MAEFHLAQLNVAKLKAPLDEPSMSGFVEALEPLNGLADGWPGFVWRLQTDAGDATSIRAFDDPLLLVNMSVWESVEALGEYVYRSGHLEAEMRLDHVGRPLAPAAHHVVWWIPAGEVLETEVATEDDGWLCPA